MGTSTSDVNRKTRAFKTSSKKKVRSKVPEITPAITETEVSPKITSDPGISNQSKYVTEHSKYATQYPLHAYIQSANRKAGDFSTLLEDHIKEHITFNIGSKDFNGKTLLELAVEKNDLDMVKILAQHGAHFDFFYVTKDAQDEISHEPTPLYLAVQKLETHLNEAHNEKSEVADYLKFLNNLQQKIKKETSLEDAVKAKDLNLVVYHTQKDDFSVSRQNQQGFNILDQVLAVREGDVKHSEATQIAAVLRSKGMELTEKKKEALDNVRAARNENIRSLVAALNGVHDKINFNQDKFISKLRYLGVKCDFKNKSEPFSFDESSVESATLLDSNFFNFDLPNQSHPNFFGFTDTVELPLELKKKYDNVKNFFIDTAQNDLLWEDTARGHLESLRSNSLLADYTVYKVSDLPADKDTEVRVIYVDAINQRCKFKYDGQTHGVDLGDTLGLGELVQEPESETPGHIQCKKRILSFLNGKGFSQLHGVSALSIVEPREIVHIVTEKKAREDKAIAKIKACSDAVDGLNSDLVSGITPCIQAMDALVSKMLVIESNIELSSDIISNELLTITSNMNQLKTKTSNAFGAIDKLESEISHTVQEFNYLPEAKQLSASITRIQDKKAIVATRATTLAAFTQKMNERLPILKSAEGSVASAGDLENELNGYLKELMRLISAMAGIKNDSKLSAAKMQEELEKIEKQVTEIEAKIEAKEITDKKTDLEATCRSIESEFKKFPKVVELGKKLNTIREQQKEISSLLQSKAAIKKEVETAIAGKAAAEKEAAEKSSADLDKLQKDLKQVTEELDLLNKELVELSSLTQKLSHDNLSEQLTIANLDAKNVKQELIRQIDVLVKKHRHLDTGFFRSIGNSSNDKILANEFARIKAALTGTEKEAEISILVHDLRVSVKDRFLDLANHDKKAFPMSDARKTLLENLAEVCSIYEKSELDPRKKRLASKEEALKILLIEETACKEKVKEKEKEKDALEERIAKLNSIVSELDAESKQLSFEASAESAILPPPPPVVESLPPSVKTLVKNSSLFNSDFNSDGSLPKGSNLTGGISVGLGMGTIVGGS